MAAKIGPDRVVAANILARSSSGPKPPCYHVDSWKQDKCNLWFIKVWFIIFVVVSRTVILIRIIRERPVVRLSEASGAQL